MYKFVVVLALFALAAAEPEAEADPYQIVGLYNDNVFGKVAPAGVKAVLKVVAPSVVAEKVEAAPMVYTHPFAHAYGGHPFGFGYNYPAFVKPVVEAVKPAKVEEKVEATPLVYTHPFAHAFGGHPFGFGYNYPAFVKPVVEAVEPAKVEEKVEAAPMVYTHPFAHMYGHPGYTGFGYNYPAVGFAAAKKPFTVWNREKREADSESDPKSWYSTYGHGYGAYGAYGAYGRYRGGYSAYPYTHGYGLGAYGYYGK